MIRVYKDDMYDVKGFDACYDKLKQHINYKCCRQDTIIDNPDKILEMMFKRFRKDPLMKFDTFDDDVLITSFCDACSLKELCNYCTSRNIEHTEKCTENVFDTVEQVLSHIVYCRHLTNDICRKITEDRRRHRLKDDNINVITESLCGLILHEFKLYDLSPSDHVEILEGKFYKFCPFCKH